jgi:uncharacterized protein (DUF433 family)
MINTLPALNRPPVVSINEAAAIVGASSATIRGDIHHHVILPVRVQAEGKNRPAFAWSDLPCLAVIYQKSFSTEMRREAFKAFRSHVFLEGDLRAAGTSPHPSCSAAFDAAWKRLRNAFAHVVVIDAKETADVPPPESIGTADAEPQEAWLLRIDETLLVDLKPGADRIHCAAALYSSGLDNRIERDPDRMGGAPVFRGTRIPVRHIGLMANAGVPMEEILEDYPELDKEDIEFARLFVEANPLMGRPSKRRERTGRHEADAG